MALLKNEIIKEKLISFSLSILIHGIIVIVLLLIKINYTSVEKNKPIQLDIKIIPPQPEKVETVKQPAGKKNNSPTRKTKQKEITKLRKKRIAVIDSTSY